MTAGAHFEVRFDWGAAGLSDIGVDAGGIVVVDVLSSTTAVEVACARGAHVYPSRWADARAGELAAGLGAALAVGRTQVSQQSPYSLSPVTLMQRRVGDRLVLPSPNGAEVFLAADQDRSRRLWGLPAQPTSGGARP